MPPLPPTEERALRAVGARRRSPGDPPTAQLIQTLRALAKESEALVGLFDARAIAGERHLLSAWAHLGRSRSRGESRLRERGAEFALYVAGDDQLPRALGKVGVADDTIELVLAVERPLDPVPLLARFGLLEDLAVFPRPVTGAVLDRLGIGADERSTVPEAAWEGLVLERVALVDLAAPAGRSSTAKS